ncbi:MAG: M20/M25/M40 family metallo-hydrolase [Bacteroidales bacterium]|nr:M20/M25/M40 family metallo-hydrolase [Bacteroidales bacterium]
MVTDLDILKREAADLLRAMVATPSLSFEEEAVSNLIASRLKGWRVDFERVGLNIVCRSKGYDPDRETLMLCAHMDTVASSPEYDFDPFTPDQPSMPGVVCGLGSNDDGGSVVSMMAAFRALQNEPLPFNLMLVLTVEEERTGEHGMRFLWREKLYGEVTWAIVGEPTGMRAATSERGLIVLDGTAHGVRGHAAREEGVNALYIAMEDIAALRSHKFAKVSPRLGEVHLNVTQISAGTVHNVVPDRCTFVVDIRPTDVYDNAALVAELQAICKSELKPRTLRNASSATPENSPLVRNCAACGIATFSSPTTSDWICLDCAAIKMGPGDSARSHKKNEYLLLDELDSAVDTYIRFIKEYGNTLEQGN